MGALGPDIRIGGLTICPKEGEADTPGRPCGWVAQMLNGGGGGQEQISNRGGCIRRSQ